MDTMERLKDVRRQMVRQWLLAPHEQASAHSCILHFAFEIALCFSFCKIGSNQKDWTRSDLVAPNGPELEPEGSCFLYC
jgi:hypothetical protein